MKIKVFLILLVIFISITLKSDTQVTVAPDAPFKFKVCLTIDVDNDQLKKNFTAFVKRELRALGDVDIVKISDNWDFIMSFNLLEHRLKNDKTKTGWISISQIISVPVPKSAFKEYKYRSIGKPVHLPDSWVAYTHVDVLLEYTITAVNNLDEMLVSYREFRKLIDNKKEKTNE